MAKPESTASTNLSDRAYEILRDRLVTLQYGPMQPLVERDLSEELGIGTTPVRDALRRLKHERLVDIYPRRGTFATGIGLADQRSLTEIRVELEALAVRLVCERATTEEKAHLLDLALADGLSMVDADVAFHRELYRLSRNNLLEEQLNQCFNLALKVWHLCARTAGTERAAPLHHETTARAIVEGRASDAVQEMRLHIVNSSERVARLMGYQ